jgi:hypothetical protein
MAAAVVENSPSDIISPIQQMVIERLLRHEAGSQPNSRSRRIEWCNPKVAVADWSRAIGRITPQAK